MAELHSLLAWVVVFSNAISGLWLLSAHWVPAARVTPMWWAAHFAHASVVVQLTVGAWLVASGSEELAGEHAFYGFLCFVSIGLIIGYRQLSQYRYLLYGLGGLFIMGLAIRAMTLDPWAM